jgi:superfamily II DNA/RNA helicase
MQDKQFHLQLKSEQKEIIQNVLERKDSMAVLPTGFGKSMCYVLHPPSIRNLYINRFTNHFSIHSQPSYTQKVVLHSITARICLRPYHFAI